MVKQGLSHRYIMFRAVMPSSVKLFVHSPKKSIVATRTMLFITPVKRAVFIHLR